LLLSWSGVFAAMMRRKNWWRFFTEARTASIRSSAESGDRRIGDLMPKDSGYRKTTAADAL
jgi:hypothetical protein